MATTRLARLVNALNGVPAGSLVYVGSGGGASGGGTPGTNFLSTRSAAIESGDVSAAAGAHGANVSLTSVASTRLAGRTKALRITTTGTGSQQGAQFYYDAPEVLGGRVWKITVVGSRPSQAADPLYKDLYVTVKWRKPKPAGQTGTDFVYEYQGGAIDSGTTALTTSTFICIAPADVVTAGVIVRYAAGMSSGAAFDVHDIRFEELTNYPNPTSAFERGFARPIAPMFAADNIWTKDVSAAPLASDSATLINTLVTKDLVDGGGPVFNLLAFASSTYVVTDQHPVSTIGFHDAQHKQYTPGELYGATSGAYRDIPMPWEAVSGGGGDSHTTIIVVDSSTGQPKKLGDYWQFYKDRAITLQEGGVTPGKAAAGDYTFRTAAQIAAAGDDWKGFSATWGGKINDLTTNNGIFPPNTGTSATGIVAAGGTVGIKEAQAGSIDHALYLSIVYPRGDTWSYPAQRSDGFVRNASQWPYLDPAAVLREGQRVRLDPTLNLTTLNLSPMGLMIAKALQKYGAIVGDKTGAVEFEGESPRPYLQRGLPNPWDAILGSQNIYQNFPWDKLQAIQVDWGKP